MISGAAEMRRMYAFLLLTAAATACGQSEEPMVGDQQPYIEKMALNLQESSIWVIEHGIDTYVREGKEGVFRKLLDGWSVQQWVEPVVGGRYLALFRIKARQMNADIQALTRTTDGAGLFEYWLVQYSGSEWQNSSVGTERHCLFAITSAERVDGVRTIIHSARQFFPSYKVNERTTVSLPLEELELLYDMRAWRYPECYPDSEIKNWEIGIDSNRRYVRIPANG
jgi:hypothetical protein